MRTSMIVVADPCADLLPRVVEAEEQRFVQQLIAHTTVEAFAEAVLHRLARRDVVPLDSVLSVAQDRMAFEVNSVP